VLDVTCPDSASLFWFGRPEPALVLSRALHGRAATVVAQATANMMELIVAHDGEVVRHFATADGEVQLDEGADDHWGSLNARSAAEIIDLLSYQSPAQTALNLAIGFDAVKVRCKSRYILCTDENGTKIKVKPGQVAHLFRHPFSSRYEWIALNNGCMITLPVKVDEKALEGFVHDYEEWSRSRRQIERLLRLCAIPCRRASPRVVL